MKTMTTRDKWLAAALPAMLILLLGWLAVLRPAARELGLLRQRAENQASLESRQALIARAQIDRADLEKEISEKRRALAAREGAFDRNWAMQQVSLLCAAHGLEIDQSKPETGALLPPALREALPALKPGAAEPQLWRLEFTGSYPHVVKLLQGLQKAKPLIIPLNLTMQPGKTERHPSSWALTLWL